MRRLRIGSVFGAPLVLDLTFFVAVPLFTAVVATQIETITAFLEVVFQVELDETVITAGDTPWHLGFAATMGLYAGVLVHELGHVLVARRYGYRTDSIVLWLFGGLAAITDTPETWRREFAIAVAGPLASVLVGVACYLLLVGLVGLALFPGDVEFPVAFLLLYLTVLHLFVAGFNMVPAFPMDGGRVLRALLRIRRPYHEATSIAATIGRVFAVLLAIYGLIEFDLVVVGIAFFVYVGASSESQQARIHAAFEGVTVDDVMTPSDRLDTVHPDTTVETLLRRIVDESHTGYPVVRDGTLVGVVTLEDARTVGPADRPDSTVGEIMSADLVTTDPRSSVVDAVGELRLHDVGRLLVLSPEGRFEGLLSRTDVVDAMERITSDGYVEGRAPERTPQDLL